MKKLMNKKIFLIIISTLLLLSMAAILIDIPTVHAAGGITRVQGNLQRNIYRFFYFCYNDLYACKW